MSTATRHMVGLKSMPESQSMKSGAIEGREEEEREVVVQLLFETVVYRVFKKRGTVCPPGSSVKPTFVLSSINSYRD